MIRSLYKAQSPFMDVPRGTGYLGVLMYDDAEDKIQCHICGKWFEHLGKHVNMAHDESAMDYKIQFGLTQKTPLCSIKYSEARRLTMTENIKAKKCANDGGAALKKMIAARRKGQFLHGGKTLQRKNAHGLCDLQMRGRYEVVKKIVGKQPYEAHLRQYDLKLWAALLRRFGTLNKARAWLGEKQISNNHSREISSADLIGHLRAFYFEHKRKPQVKDFPGGGLIPGNSTYWKRFGSWTQALSAAGLR